ncbi:hypothetical protein PG994_002534 [Apiospora phragmitis]|uniref:Heterokaryon incompatibility domain-containing protein n=1 Tax=Apiospora phragmitis TaxID=2905665 RepID=A0ABR1W6M4_9PEZI
MPSSHNVRSEVSHRLRNRFARLFREIALSRSSPNTTPNTTPNTSGPCAACATALETPCAACNLVLSTIHETIEFWKPREKRPPGLRNYPYDDSHKVVRRGLPALDECQQCQQPKCKLCRALLALAPAGAVTSDGRSPEMFGNQQFLLCTCSKYIFSSGMMPTHYHPTLHFAKPSYGWQYSQNSHAPGWAKRVGSISLLAVHPIDDNEQVHYRSILPHSVDLDFIKDNIEICAKEHKSCQNRLEEVIGLKVIDCESQKVVLAPAKCQYIALSYVWGAAQADATVAFPRVVRDSITVATALGCQYLWVDRYCIDQEDTQKQGIFNQMHRVYSNAFLTIIAAAGLDADHGLPGVSSCRPKQINFQLGDLQFDEVFPFDDLALANSIWATRAWTYQESYFSRRRLCFTEKQLIWICNSRTQAECISESTLDTQRKDYAHALTTRPHTSLPQPHYSLRSKPVYQDLQRDIGLYTARRLSYPSDSLNAILGVLRYYVELTAESRYPPVNKFSISHAWGVPLYKEIESQEISFNIGWKHSVPGTRRPEFPSWSWAGWAGSADLLDSSMAPELSWCFITDSHKELPLDALHNQAFQAQDAPRLLAITTKICPVTLWDSTDVVTKHTTTSKFRVVFQLTEAIYAGIDWKSDEVPDARESYWAASLSHKGTGIMNTGSRLNVFHGCQMILRKRGQDFERIGISYMAKRIPLDTTCIFFDAVGNILDNIEAKERLEVPDGYWWWYEHAQTHRICIS